jgi:hypothetical protein
MCRALPVIGQDLRELPRNRHRSRRAIRLGRAEPPTSVDLECKLDLRLFERVEPRSLPGQTEQSESLAPISAATVNSVRYGSSAAATVCSSSPPSKTRLRVPCDGFGRSDESMSDTGFVPTQPSRRAAYR